MPLRSSALALIALASACASSLDMLRSAGLDTSNITVLQGPSPEHGIAPTGKPVSTRNEEDLRAPKLQIVWEHAADIPAYSLPANARIFSRERWKHAPLMAGWKQGEKIVLWTAVDAGENGYERFPYLPQAAAELGAQPIARSNRLWAFFDGSYRSRADVDYLAPQWKKAGIAALHIAAWHYWERDSARDAYLNQLIAACHRNGILVYAWFEFPHVSERFWDDHPEWREKTALNQDARLDWRKLINLQNKDAAAAVAEGFDRLLMAFDWDGANLAELYFESLEGPSNPARFTPFNADALRGFSGPVKISDKRFLDYRAELARQMQTEWLDRADEVRKRKPHLDIVLTHVDDRFDTSMREKIGADAGEVLPLLKQRDFTFLVEDPATIWDLGPKRYSEIAAKYRPITPRPENLAIDINVTGRYQDTYPTKQQTGSELFALVRQASASFPRVALYFESSIPALDWPLLGSSAAALTRYERTGARIETESAQSAGIAFNGPALVDGKLWPFTDNATVWLPAGLHRIEPSMKAPPIRILNFTGDIGTVRITAAVEFTYKSSARAIATLDRTPKTIEVDGEPVPPTGTILFLPRGQHLVSLE